MSKTVLLCNPLGTDVSQLMNTLLRGTVLDPSDTLINIAYTNQPGEANIADGVDKLDDKINDNRGEKLVFAYSEVAQVATRWLREHNATADVPSGDMSFGGGQYPYPGQGSWGAGNGSKGAAWVRFVQK